MARSTAQDGSTSADPYRVEAVDRALVLLTLLVERERLTVSEAADELGVAPSTAHRLLATMVYRGFVVQGAKRQYYPGPQLAGPRSVGRRAPQLAGLLRPHLQALAAEVGETVHLMVLMGADMYFADGIESDQTLRVALRTGSRVPAYCTSGGKAVLAELGDAAVTALHAGGLRPWPGQEGRTLDGLLGELVEVRRRRFGINREESEPGVVALGAAVGPRAGDPVAAFTVAVPTVRFDRREEQHIVDSVRAACRAAQDVLTPDAA